MSLFFFSGRAFPLVLHSLGPFPFCVYLFEAAVIGCVAARLNGRVDRSLFMDREVYEMEKVQPTWATRIGQWGGRQWCRYVRQEAKVIRWLRCKGLPEYFTDILALTTRLGFLLAMLIPVVSLAVIFAIAYVSAKCNGNTTRDVGERSDGEESDHRKSVFYDPINYNDPDDPRFDD